MTLKIRIHPAQTPRSLKEEEEEEEALEKFANRMKKKNKKSIKPQLHKFSFIALKKYRISRANVTADEFSDSIESLMLKIPRTFFLFWLRIN